MFDVLLFAPQHEAGEARSVQCAASFLFYMSLLHRVKDSGYADYTDYYDSHYTDFYFYLNYY